MQDKTKEYLEFLKSGDIFNLPVGEGNHKIAEILIHILNELNHLKYCIGEGK